MSIQSVDAIAVATLGTMLIGLESRLFPSSPHVGATLIWHLRDVSDFKTFHSAELL